MGGDSPPLKASPAEGFSYASCCTSCFEMQKLYFFEIFCTQVQKLFILESFCSSQDSKIVTSSEYTKILHVSMSIHT